MKWLSNPYRVLIAILVSTVIIHFSCKKEKSQDLTPAEEVQANRASVEADAEAEDIYSGLFDDAMGVNPTVAMGGTGIFGRGAGNPTSREDTAICVHIISPSTNTFPSV